MREKISKLSLWVGTFIVGIVIIIELLHKNYIEATLCIPLGICFCPLIDDNINKKINNTEKNGYFQKVRIIISFLAVIVVILFVMGLVANMNPNYISEEKAFAISEIILKTLMYLIYLSITFMYRDIGKYPKYIFFGIFYCVCVIISFFPNEFDSTIANQLNCIFIYQHLDGSSYRLLIDGVIMPIKESILTYIIFDTAFDNVNSVRNMRTNDSEENDNVFYVHVKENTTNMKRTYLIKAKKRKLLKK